MPAVQDVHCKLEGVIRTAMMLRRGGCGISRHKACKIMMSKGFVEDSPAEHRRRISIGYERAYHNATWHTDRHATKDPRAKGDEPDHHLDDASRCVTGAALFRRQPRRM